MKPVLSVRGLDKRFGAVVVAHDVDLVLAEGEALGIIGPNGAGKSTLFGIASGSVRPDAGRVVLAGVDVTGLAPERRCHLGIGRSFQIPQPFHGMSVFENLVVAAAFGRSRSERDVYPRCVELLEHCALADQANQLRGDPRKPLFALWHFPPFEAHARPGPPVELFERAGVTACVYGHLHNEREWQAAVQGLHRGVRYHCVAADAIGFHPLRIDPA